MPKRRKATPRQVALKKRQRGLKKRQQHLNPFNRITTKNLHNSVLGQRVKGNVKYPTHSISRSIEKRKETLLAEYTAIETNQRNTFIDRRYEKTLENKLSKLRNKKMHRDKKKIEQIMRKLTSQRLKSNKKVSFNLDDTDTNTRNDMQLTHLGTPINEYKIMDNYEYDDDDDDNKYLYKGFNKKNIYNMIKHKQMTFEQIADAAGISLNKHANTTKPQIIKQTILRSRFKKCKQQIAKEGLMDETDIVDDKFKHSKEWLFANRSNKNNKNNINNENNNNRNIKREIKQKKADLEYQQKLIEFETDQRSGVTDKMVTDAQKAQRNYELLTILEQKRQRKMLADSSDSDMSHSDNKNDNDNENGNDNHNDNEELSDDDDGNDTNWTKILDEIAAQEEDEESDDDMSINNDNDNDGVDDDEHGYYADIDTRFLAKNKDVGFDHFEEDAIIGGEPAGEGEDNIFDIVREKEIAREDKERKDKLNKKLSITKDFDWNVLELNKLENNLIGKKLENISFTLDIPANIEEFEELMSNKTASQQITLLKRMRSTNHVKLHQDNIFKIQRLYDMLLDYFRQKCINYTPSKTEVLSNDIAFYKHIDVITRALFALSHDVPEYAYCTHVKKLETISTHIHNNYNLKHNKQYIMDEDEKENDDDVSYMPSGYALFYLKLVSNIFPKGNKSNPLISSLLLILCKCITNIRINGARDILCYLFCITLILETIKKERRYVPEVIHSLHNLLKAGFLSNNNFKLKQNSFNLLRETNDVYFTFSNASNIWSEAMDNMDNNEAVQLQLAIRYIFLKNNDENVLNGKQFKVQALYTTLKIIFKCHEIYNSLLSYSEIFKPFYNFLSKEEIKKKMCETNNILLIDLYNNLLRCLKQKIFIQSMTRKPLQLIHKKRALQTLEPDFDPDLKPSFLRLKVRNVQALEKKKKRILKKAIKKQQKAVMKEFQKDTQFIMNEKTKHRIDSNIKRQAKWSHEWHNLTEQQRDTNSFQMVGKKLKKKLMKQGVIRGF